MAPKVTGLDPFEIVDVMSRVYIFYAEHKRGNTQIVLHETSKLIKQ